MRHFEIFERFLKLERPRQLLPLLLSWLSVSNVSNAKEILVFGNS